jgi:hypothetical protein
VVRVLGYRSGGYGVFSTFDNSESKGGSIVGLYMKQRNFEQTILSNRYPYLVLPPDVIIVYGS